MKISLSELDWKRAAILVFFLLLLADIVALNLKVFKPEKEIVKGPEKEVAETGVTQSGEVNFCPTACLETISEATAASVVQTVPASQLVSTAGKEFYIPLGSGSTKSTDWVELMGIESVIDMGNYPDVKTIVFEASMRIPTANGRVYAKLYNVTDKHDAWNSEVSAEGSSGYRAEAIGVVLAPGRKLYRVKMRTTMGYEAILDSARVKIILN